MDDIKKIVRSHEKAIEQAVACCEQIADEVKSLRAELEQQTRRAEAAEYDLHAERLAHAETQAKLGVTS